MTPFAKKVLRGMMRDRQMGFVALLAEAVCFDLTPARDAVRQAAAEMSTLFEIEDGATVASHGGLLFAPAPVYWIEICIPGAPRMGALLSEAEDEIGYQLIGEGGIQGCFFMQTRPDGDTFTVHPDTRFPAHLQAPDGATAGLMLAAATMIINAPRGVERQPVFPHKGLARDLRAAGLGPMRDAHTIYLRPLTATEKAGDAAGGGLKAWHYCRSHLRNLASGVSVRVRGHFRGDPALGVLHGDYRLKG